MPSGSFAVSNSSGGMSTWINWSTSDEPWNNRSYVVATLYAQRSSATTFGTGTWTLALDGAGQSWTGQRSVSTSPVAIISAGWWVGHDANGAKGVTISVSGGIPGTSWSSTSGAAFVGLTNYVRLPGAPYNLSVVPSSVTTQNFAVQYARDAAGTIITQDHAEWSRADNGQVVWNDFAPVGYTSPGGGSVAGAPALLPGIEYRVRVRSASSDGWGPFSAYIHQRTLSAAYVGKGGSYPPAAELRVGKAGSYVLAAEVRVGKGGSFVQGG